MHHSNGAVAETGPSQRSMNKARNFVRALDGCCYCDQSRRQEMLDKATRVASGSHNNIRDFLHRLAP